MIHEAGTAQLLRRAGSPTVGELLRTRAACRAGLAPCKLPKEIRIVASRDDFPRSTSGKVQRQQVERWLD